MWYTNSQHELFVRILACFEKLNFANSASLYVFRKVWSSDILIRPHSYHMFFENKFVVYVTPYSFSFFFFFSSPLVEITDQYL